MDIGGLPSKIAGNADKIGLVVGAYATLQALGKQWGMDPMQSGVELFMRLTRTPHIPDLGLSWQTMQQNGFIAEAGAAIAGWFLKEVDLFPQLNQLGNVLMKAGIGAAEANAVISLISEAGR